MGKISSDPFDNVAFRCSCGRNFDAKPDKIEDESSRPWHPWSYQAVCECGEYASQAAWEISLYKARSRATGPKTAEGKAAVTKNIEGHPTPEEALRTRFNALKTGISAKVATFFPAKPGKYAACQGCEFFDGCGSQPACQKRTELYLRHHIAFETRDPSMLSGLRATLHANISAIIDDIVLSIIQEGVSLKTPEWYYDKEGTFCFAYGTHPSTGETILIEKTTAHPLLKTLGDLVAKNGMTLTSENMTTRQQESFVDESDKDAGLSAQEMREFQDKSSKQMDGLMQMINRSNKIIDITPESNG